MAHNLLIDRLPARVRVGGADIPIRTDFRVGLLLELMLWDKRLAPRDKVAQTLRLYFDEADLPGDLAAAYRAALWFFRGGQPPGGGEAPARRLYCYDADAGPLYAAFRAQYGLDLQDVDTLHWWKFRALFAALTPEHEVCRRMAIRAARLADAQSREERARLARLKARYRLDAGEDMGARAGAIFRGGE